MQDSARVLVVGAGSLLGRAFCRFVPPDQLVEVSRHQLPSASEVTENDVLVNFAFHPGLLTEAYREEWDVDAALSKLAAASGSRYVLVSSRKVYGAEWQRGAVETDPTPGLDAYGKNKVEIEKRVRDLVPEHRHLVLRVANVIGYEFHRTRPSFMSFLMASLKQDGRVLLTIDKGEVRDFISDTCFGETAARLVAEGASGTFNVGSGLKVTVGEIASWLAEGYGGGAVESMPNGSNGEFWLNIQKLCSSTEFRYSSVELRDTCMALGQRLRAE